MQSYIYNFAPDVCYCMYRKVLHICMTDLCDFSCFFNTETWPFILGKLKSEKKFTYLTISAQYISVLNFYLIAGLSYLSFKGNSYANNLNIF
jgi:hypothetical protein